jgi:hypothetical protein
MLVEEFSSWLSSQFSFPLSFPLIFADFSADLRGVHSAGHFVDLMKAYHCLRLFIDHLKPNVFCENQRKNQRKSAEKLIRGKINPREINPRET